MKQTALEYFIEELFKQIDYIQVDLKLIEQAKAMEKEQIKEAERKYAEALDRHVAELDALDDEPEFDSAGFSIADRFEDTEEDTHHCDDPGCNCSI